MLFNSYTFVIFLVTNVPPNFITSWYRNGQLMTTSPNSLSWSTNISTNADTVRAKVHSDSICIAEVDKWSNSVVLAVSPNGVNIVGVEGIKLSRNPESKEVVISNLRGGEYLNIFNCMGQIIVNYHNENNSRIRLPLEFQNQGILILKIQRNNEIKLIKF